VLFHPDGTCIASGSTDGSLKVSQQLCTSLPCSGLLDLSCKAAAWDPELAGPYGVVWLVRQLALSVLSCIFHQTSRWWHSPKLHDSYMTCCACAALPAHCLPIQLWDLRSNALLQHYGGSSSSITSAAWHPSGNFLLTSSLDTTLKVGQRTQHSPNPTACPRKICALPARLARWLCSSLP
jgi:WD40 repeat protein